MFKMNGPRVQTFCIEKDSCKYLYMMLFFPKQRRLKYFLSPHIKQKHNKTKRRMDTNGSDMAKRTYLFACTSSLWPGFY